MHAATHLRVEWTALLLGLALAGLAVAGWRVDGGLAVPPAEVSLVTSASDTLAVTPTAEVGGTLRESDSDRGLESRMTVRNATGGAVAVRFKAEPRSTALDEALLVRVTAKGQTAWEGPLGALRAGTPDAFVLQSHEMTDVTVTAWIPGSADDAEWRARSESVTLSFLTEGTA